METKKTAGAQIKEIAEKVGGCKSSWLSCPSPPKTWMWAPLYSNFWKICVERGLRLNNLGLVFSIKIEYNIKYICISILILFERKVFPMKLETELGEIRVSSDVFTTVTGSAATNCYGVKGMAVRSTTDGLVHLLKRESMAKGVKVYYNADGTVSIELHIIVENGVNLMAVCRSIMSEVRYVVSKTTGVEVASVDVCVDSMRF